MTNQMIEVKTCDLSAEALNYAVALAEGLKPFICDPQYGNPHLVCVPHEHATRGSHRYAPCEYWEQGGALIEKHRVDLITDGVGRIAAYCCSEEYQPITEDYYGSTHLIAACRAIVASKLGDTVSIPRELLP